MSAARIDHAAEAERLLDLANGYELANGTSGSTEAALVVIGAVANGYAHAQVHATLAFVEQQRITNLLLLIKPENPREFDTWDEISEALRLRS